MLSVIKLMPGPEVAVMAFAPAQAAPMTEEMEPISSSICIKVPPTSGSRWTMRIMISPAGVMG